MLGTGCSQEAINHLDILELYGIRIPFHLGWGNSRHLAMSPSLVFPWNQVEEWAQKYPYWWFVTNHVCVFTSDWWKQIFPQSITNHKHKWSLKSNTTSDVHVKCLRSFCGETSGCITKCQLFYWTIGLQD